MGTKTAVVVHNASSKTAVVVDNSTTQMSIKTAVVVHNATTKKHEPLASGDKLAGSLVQLSTDAGQSIALGTDGGLFVNTVVALPDDQVLTGDNSGSVNLTLTPATQPNGDVNYTFKGEVKIDSAAGNAAVVSASGLYVATPVVPTFVAGNAPTVVEDGTTTTRYFGGNTIALGNPSGWEKRAGTTKVYPVYDEGSVGGGAPTVAGKQTEFGESLGTTNDVTVTFATPFPTIPFITVTPFGDGSKSSDYYVDSITTTAFVIRRGYQMSSNGLMDLCWKAEEK